MAIRCNRLSWHLSNHVILTLGLVLGASRGLPAQVFVDQSATGANNGTSWANAYTDLQTALTATSSGQIWVANGTYKPGTTQSSTFSLKSGVALYGGFAGGEALLSDRDVGDNHCILSGDLSGNDPIITDNAFRVVTSNNTDASAVLDGFTITAGLANGAGLITNFGGSQTVENCTFVGNGGNIPPKGGGAYLGDGFPVFIDCTFRDNVAKVGGGVYVENAFATFINCRFIGNTASIASLGAGYGGGLVAAGSGGVKLFNCMFSANVAEAFAGAIGREMSQFFEIRGCTFSKNEAQSPISAGGGGLDIVNSPIPTFIRNSTFWGNFDAFGDANQNTEILGIAGADIDYCCIQGFTGGGNNITTNPQFVDVDGLDDVLGTPDDNVQVTFGSSIIDVANDAALPQDTYDLDGDTSITEPIPFDIAGNPRDFDGNQTAGAVTDMSAYEFVKCQPDVGYDGPGHLTLSLCGDDLATFGSTATLLISGASFGQQVVLVTSFGVNLTPYNGGLSTLVPDLAPPNFIYNYFFNADVNGQVTFPINGGNQNVTHVYMQAVGAGSPKIVSNAIDVRIGN